MNSLSAHAALQEANAAASQVALMLYCDEVRRLLLKFSGYECAVGPLSGIALKL